MMSEFTDMPDILKNLMATAVGTPASKETMAVALDAVKYTLENYHPGMTERQMTDLILSITGDNEQATSLAILAVGLEVVRRQKEGE